FTPVSADGEFLANAMVSSDARAVAIVESFSRQFGARRLYDLTGHTPHPMFTLFKLLWLRQERPDVFAQAQRFLCFEDLFQQHLGVEPAMSWPLAGRTMLFNVQTHRWEDAILQAAGLDASRLAQPAASGTVVGTIPRTAADDLGLPTGVLVVTGGHDQPMGALGAGVTEPGVAMFASGTVECICPAFDQPRLDEPLFNANLCTYDYTLPGMYTTVLFSLTGGNLLRWFRDQWGQPERAEAERTGADVYDLLTRAMAAEPSNLLVLPYFTPSGTPYFDARVPGAILGLRLTTTRGEVLRALIEGVAMEMRLNLEVLAESGLAVRQLRAIGGGAKSRALVQLKADVLDRPITTLAVSEAACLGAALLACSAHTSTAPGDLLAAWVQPGPAVEPDASRAARYRQRFAAYRELYPAMRDAWQRLGG
ncbi:MAG: FGGY-family carbohydrate kinase, partial [Patescibacteria group bacterium]|nr:FGGY-family carbohydrate kinase [Patescibacteria group bacterium]